MNSNETPSKLGFRCIFGVACMALGLQEVLAWAEIISAESGWLMRLAGNDFMEPIPGLLLIVTGIALIGPGAVTLFSVRDAERKKARQATLFAALIAGVGAVFAVQSFIPSADVLPVFGNGAVLPKASRQATLLGLLICFGGVGGFIMMRRNDVGFWKLAIPLERSNEIWRLTMKVEVAIRALPKNAEAYHLAEQRMEFVQAEVGAKFDKFCEPLIKESADLSTIDNTARLQMDVGHVFKRYADFHRRLAEKRHNLCEDLMKAAYDAIVDLLEHDLPGQTLPIGVADGIKISISHPVLTDSPLLQKRRGEWDETLRTIVSIGAEKGNQIIGDWIEKAARGNVSPDEVPVAVQALRALCQQNGRPDHEYPEHGKTLALGFNEQAVG